MKFTVGQQVILLRYDRKVIHCLSLGSLWRI